MGQPHYIVHRPLIRGLVRCPLAEPHPSQSTTSSLLLAELLAEYLRFLSLQTNRLTLTSTVRNVCDDNHELSGIRDFDGWRVRWRWWRWAYELTFAILRSSRLWRGLYQSMDHSRGQILFPI